MIIATGVKLSHAPWLSWLERVTVMMGHHKVESSSLSGADIFWSVFIYTLIPRVD